MGWKVPRPTLRLSQPCQRFCQSQPCQRLSPGISRGHLQPKSWEIGVHCWNFRCLLSSLQWNLTDPFIMEIARLCTFQPAGTLAPPGNTASSNLHPGWVPLSSSHDPRYTKCLSRYQHSNSIPVSRQQRIPVGGDFRRCFITAPCVADDRGPERRGFPPGPSPWEESQPCIPLTPSNPCTGHLPLLDALSTDRGIAMWQFNDFHKHWRSGF